MVEGLGSCLGKAHKIVLHGLKDFQHSVIYINHGGHTSRKVGAPITDKALGFLIKFSKNSSKRKTYYSASAKREPLKSTTIATKGENDCIAGLLCMNFYMNISFYDLIHTFVRKKISTAENDSAAETFANNVDDMITPTLGTVKEGIYNDLTINSSNKNKETIYDLYNKGIF